MNCSGSTPVRTEGSQNRTLGRRLKPAAFGLFALFALIALVGARGAFAQDAPASGSDSDANWERIDPDFGADSAEKVLEIPQIACVEDGVSIPCDEQVSASNSPGNGNDNGDDDANPQASSGSSPASPQTLDDDTASAGPIGSDSDWGTADDYANQPIYGIPYGTAQYGRVISRGPIYGNPQVPPSMAFPFPPMAMSSPLTQAARPPLNPTGPWMTPPSMMMLSRPAGSPMAGQPFRFH
jgi:hypothetical protein